MRLVLRPWYKLGMRSSSALGAVLLLMFSLGSSRPLASKEAAGTFTGLPGGLVAAGTPRAFLGENVDNQGCFSRQRLDLAVSLPLRNESQRTLLLDEAQAVLVVDGSSQPLRERVAHVGDKPLTIGFRHFSLAPGQMETVRVRSNAFTGKAGLEDIKDIEVVIPIDGGEVRATFNLRALPVRNTALNADEWESGRP